MKYKTPAALEMAVKEAAKKSPLDTNHAIAEQVAKESRARKVTPLPVRDSLTWNPAELRWLTVKDDSIRKQFEE